MFKTQKTNVEDKTFKILVAIFTAVTFFYAASVKAEEATHLILESATNSTTPAISIDIPGMLKLDQTPEFKSVKSDWTKPKSGVRFGYLDEFLISVSEQNRPLMSSLEDEAYYTAMNFDMDYPKVSEQNLLNSNFAKSFFRKLTGTK